MIIKPNLDEKTSLGEQLFYQIGNNGPFILWITSLLLLRNKNYYFIYYLIGYVFNILLNQLLKILFKQPRPSVNKHTFDLAIKQMKNINSYTNLISYDAVLGMPSGHTQGVFYSFVYILLVYSTKPLSNLILFYYLSILFITIIQRVYYQFHSINQIIVGAIIGIGYAYFIHYLAKKQIKGLLKVKVEEYGPL
jgi:membrane-associated phospholipid phosphatase